MDKKTEYIDTGMISMHLQTLGDWEENYMIDVDHLENYLDVFKNFGLNTRCNEIPFKKGLQVLLTDPKTNLEDFVSYYRNYDNDEGRKIMEFVWKTLWSNDPIPTEPLPNVEVIPVFGNRFATDWDVCRGWFWYTQEGDTFRKIANKTGKSLDFLLERNKGYPSGHYGSDEPMPEEKMVHLRYDHECIERDRRGLYFHELPLKTQYRVQNRHAIQPSGAVCPFDGNWMLTHVEGKSVAFVTRSFNQGDVLPDIDGKPAQWQLLIDHPET